MKTKILGVVASYSFQQLHFPKIITFTVEKFLILLLVKELSNQTIVVSKNKIIKIQDGFIVKTKPEDIEIDLKKQVYITRLNRSSCTY
jgi:hypothetical protein